MKGTSEKEKRSSPEGTQRFRLPILPLGYNPSETLPFLRVTERLAEPPEEENQSAMFERVRREDEEFTREVERLLQGMLQSVNVKVLDFRYIPDTEPKKYVFTVMYDGAPEEVIISRVNGHQEREAA